jgi:hypothetical protein
MNDPINVYEVEFRDVGAMTILDRYRVLTFTIQLAMVAAATQLKKDFGKDLAEKVEVVSAKEIVHDVLTPHHKALRAVA